MNKENSELNEKIAYMEGLLQKNIFQNPVQEVQNGLRNELIDFKATLLKNLGELDKYLVTL
jgi:hypothetical protein